MTMCFKCGAVDHPGSSCNSVGNAELRNYVKQFNVQKCPSCGFGTQKIDGCNHMTCVKCRHNWCWLCRGKYSSGHFSSTNIFGCPGGQYGDDNTCFNIIKKLLLIIFMPLYLFCLGFGYTVGWFCEECMSGGCNFVCQVLMFFLIVLPASLCAGGLAAVVSPLAILVQLFLLSKIFWKLLYQYCGCCCCCC